MDAPLIRVGHGLRAAASAAGPAASGLASRSISGASRSAICHPSRATAVAATVAARHFSALNRPPPKYPGHVPLTKIEQAGMAIGSGIMSLFNPYRAVPGGPRDGGQMQIKHMMDTSPQLMRNLADLIATLGEATATPYFIYRLRDAMLAHPTGRRILRLRPRISSKTLSIPALRALPANSVGRAYVEWLDREGVSPDTRSAVKYIDDEECAYVMQRYRECHDFYHALTGLPTVREGEVALKAFEFANTLLPMTGLSMLAVATLKPAERRRFFGVYMPWAVKNGVRSKDIINVFWEEELERDVDDLRRELGIEQPPDLRAIRKREKEEKRRLKEMRAQGF
ncbi:ubiquinone biosynthesis protein coq-4, mitochondrial [Trichoderma gamsii]|uniref:4-hydroxy-3-methoxy-5-polyprenylbenzoate decarboxylase n=1 Tax=Trichoderma gamsii TaxID=398673 RepID=A0A2P4ZEM0_9HYPO|nr:ubiquinone biosynthesis protein coq-4, mitochondrial [Trichoderma gamsii]PON22728.1 ubiquinone biosynthesis protein coq-4, mitochondrial [Trichoderma gamsii]